MRYLVYREDLVGSVEAASWGIASANAFRQFGERVIRVSPAAGAPSEDRIDREREMMAARKLALNNDGESDGA